MGRNLSNFKIRKLAEDSTLVDDLPSEQAYELLAAASFRRLSYELSRLMMKAQFRVV